MAWIEKYGHGGDLLTAQTQFGLGSTPLLDFSANINPLGPPPKVMQTIKEQLETIVHYPDPAQRKLKEKLARRLELQTEQIIIGNGAAECMALIILALEPKTVGVVYPCFSEYEKLSNAFGAKIKACYGRAEQQFKPKLQDLFALFNEVDLVFIGHPNNPTGVIYSLAELEEIAAQAESTNTYLVIDEAFIDFIPKNKQVTLLPNLEQYKNIIFVRSMTKFYAIPGLRLGFAVAQPEIIAKLQNKQVTWSVNQLALTAGEICLDEIQYEEETIALIEEQREYLKQAIQERFGWFVFSGQANFLLIRLPQSMNVAKLQWEMGKRGVMIRSCAMYPGLTDQDFRIAVRTKQENDQLLSALQKVVDEGGANLCR
ncbi:threonine-phosphate decarboxylase CobD [Bacillus marasmi]|uniref:threonine-phosphate decarboxylase CobD n=1 Tax=Bacillus marasmi TaxID=1926279 RepID=UPI0011C7E8F4|nr:threonine-phosphate decarboxylase CobD [Bacillus marasmi]